MSLKKTHLLVASLFLALLSLMFVSFTPSTLPPLQAVNYTVPVPGSGGYSESFSTTTYRDAPNSTAVGWGSGYLANNRDGYLSLFDSIDTFETVRSVEIQGRKLYATLYKTTTGTNALRVYNISDPTNMALLGTQHPATYLISGEIDGDLMFIGQSDLVGNPTWKIYNVSNPTSIPAAVSSIAMGSGNITDFEIQGHFLYMAVSLSSGLDFHIYDIADPTTPVLTYSQLWTNILGIDISGQILAGCNGDPGLYIRNVSDPYAPFGTDSLNTPGVATDAIIDGDVCYVADGPAGVQVVDISNPYDISIIGSYNTPGNAIDLELQGNTLVVADESGGTWMLDVSTPSTPLPIAWISIAPSWDVSIQDGILAVAADTTIYLYSLGVIDNDYLYSTYSTYDAFDVDVQGDIAYVAAGADGLVVLNVSDPANPVLLDRVWYGATIDYTTVDVQGTHAYITNWGPSYKGLQCFDIMDPNNVIYRDYYSLTYPYDVTVAGELAYVADGPLGLYLLDVSNPSNLQYFTHDTTMDNCSGVAVQGHFVYAVGNGSTMGGYGLLSYNLNDLTNIKHTHTIQFVDAEDVVVSGDFAAIANGWWGVNLVDMTDPWAMINTNGLQFSGSYICTAVEMFRTFIFAAERGVGIHFIDASNINNIQRLDTYTTSSTDVRSMTIAGDYLYAACGDRLLTIRVFESYCDRWETGTYGQSLEVDTTTRTIENATVTISADIPYGTSINFELSADGGVHMESITVGSPHSFFYQGNKLLWKATFNSPFNDRTARLNSLNIDYAYNDLPTAPVLTDPGASDNDGAFDVTWTASTDDGGIDNYLLQMSGSATFAVILNAWTPTTTTQSISGLTNGTYYFRVRAIDNDGESGPWSNDEAITVAIPPSTPPTPPPPIPGFPIEAIAIGAIVALGIGVMLRRRKRQNN